MRWSANQGKKLIRAIFLGKQFIGYSLLAGKGNKISIYQQWAEIIISQDWISSVKTFSCFGCFLPFFWYGEIVKCYPFFISFYFVIAEGRLFSEQWFHGRISREQSLELLMNAGLEDGWDENINQSMRNLTMPVDWSKLCSIQMWDLKWWLLANGCLFNHCQATIIDARVSSMPFHLTCT